MTMTYGQLQDALRAAISGSVAADPDANDVSYVWIIDFSDTFVVYELEFDQYFQDNYTVDDNGVVTLAGNPVPVQSVTTYVPVEQQGRVTAALEERGLRAMRAPGGRRPVPSSPTVTVRSEPFTYHRHSRTSFFRDMLLETRDPAAGDRLRRHRQEMDVVSREREERAWRALRSGDFEYRVEPNRTDGQGGYFSPPLWLNELFATAPRPGRVLADLIRGHFDLPVGVSTINLPVILSGTAAQPVADTQAVPDQDVTDSPGSSAVVTISGQADSALQLLEQSPAGAHLDWAFFQDLTSSYDADLEAQLLVGLGANYNQLLGVTNADTAVAYTSGSPTGAGMYPVFGKAAGTLADSRNLPPEAWLMRTARWSWLMTQEDSTGLPFGVFTQFFLGNEEGTPDPIGGLLGFPVFLDDAIPANSTLGAGGYTTTPAGTQDFVVALRPSDLILFEGQPQVNVYREPLSGSLGARIQLHNSVAAITNRFPAGIVTVGGTGFVVQSGF